MSRRISSHGVNSWAALLLLSAACLLTTPASRAFVIDPAPDAITIRGLTQVQLYRLAQLTELERREVISVYVGDQPARELDVAVSVVGETEFFPNGLKFIPRSPLAFGQPYHVEFSLAPIGGEILELEETIVLRPTPKARVTAVYPSGPEVPANLCRLHLYFSHPVDPRPVHRHLQLLDENGRAVDLSGLRAHQSLWNLVGTRLSFSCTAREDTAPGSPLVPLEAGKDYTLVVDKAWPDKRGAPLVEGFRHSFTVTQPDRTAPAIEAWTLEGPAVDTRQPLQVRFDEPLDRALLKGLGMMRGEQALRGTTEVEDGGRLWRFTPAQPWQAGSYSLSVPPWLRDYAGHRVGSPRDARIKLTFRLND